MKKMSEMNEQEMNSFFEEAGNKVRDLSFPEDITCLLVLCGPEEVPFCHITHNSKKSRTPKRFRKAIKRLERKMKKEKKEV